MDMLQIKPVKMMKSNTYTNIGILKDKLKLLGINAFEMKEGKWINFGISAKPSFNVDPSNSISISTRFVAINVLVGDEDLIAKMPAIYKAIMDFYKAEGIVD